MKVATTILLVLVILCGAGALVLGLAFWSGHGWSLIRVHQALGLTLVAALCILAIVSWRSTGRAAMPAFTIVYAAAVAALGLGQSRLLPGSSHWIIQILHLATAGYAVALGRQLALAGRRKPPAGSPPAALRP